MKYKKLNLLVIAVLLFSAAAHAQTRFVMSVGAQSLSGGLHFLDSDARLVADVLRGPASNVALLSSEDRSTTYPDVKAVNAQIERICASAKPEDSVWLYFSCHGTNNQEDSSYLVLPQAPDKSSVDLYSVADLRAKLRSKCKAKVVVLMMDACQSGTAKALPLAHRPEAAFGDVSGIVTFAGCKVDQTSMELPELRHGLFTFFLVKGLAGEAKDASGRFTLRALADYVQSNVSGVAEARGSHQNPVVLIPNGQDSVAVQPGNTSVATTLPPVDPTTVQTQLMEPLPPGIVVSIQGTPGEALADYIEGELTHSLIEHRYPVYGSQQSRGYEAMLNNRDTVEAAKQASRMNARFLLRAKVQLDVTTNRHGSVDSMTCVCSLNLQLIDSDGKVICTLNVTDPNGDQIKGVGFSDESAKRNAIKNALAIGTAKVLQKVDDAKLTFPSKAQK